MIAYKLAAAILLCACANGLVDIDRNVFEHRDNYFLDARPNQLGKPLVKKVVSQLEAFVKFANKLLVQGKRNELKFVLHETTKLAGVAVRLAREANSSRKVLEALNSVYRLASKVENLSVVQPANTLYRQLELLYNNVKTAEYLLGVPVLPFDPRGNHLAVDNGK